VGGARLVETAAINTGRWFNLSWRRAACRLEVRRPAPRLPLNGTHFVDISMPALVNCGAGASRPEPGHLAAVLERQFRLVCRARYLEHVAMIAPCRKYRGDQARRCHAIRPLHPAALEYVRQLSGIVGATNPNGCGRNCGASGGRGAQRGFRMQPDRRGCWTRMWFDASARTGFVVVQPASCRWACGSKSLCIASAPSEPTRDEI